MQVSDLNNNVKNITKKSTSKKQPVQLKDMLSTILNIVENFEKHGKIDFKGHRERIDILTSFISDFIRDYDQKITISGGQ
jgi:DNA mismatch repair ATPase MutS